MCRVATALAAAVGGAPSLTMPVYGAVPGRESVRAPWAPLGGAADLPSAQGAFASMRCLAEERGPCSHQVAHA